LLTGLDLVRAQEWLPGRPDDLPREVTAFVQRSIAHDRAVKERQLKFQRRVSIGAIAAAVVMAIVVGAAVLLAFDAEKQLRQAQVTQSVFLADLARQQREA